MSFESAKKGLASLAPELVQYFPKQTPWRGISTVRNAILTVSLGSMLAGYASSISAQTPARSESPKQTSGQVYTLPPVTPTLSTPQPPKDARARLEQYLDETNATPEQRAFLFGETPASWRGTKQQREDAVKLSYEAQLTPEQRTMTLGAGVNGEELTPSSYQTSKQRTPRQNKQFYDTRRSFVAQMREQGMDTNAIAFTLGTTSEVVRYVSKQLA